MCDIALENLIKTHKFIQNTTRQVRISTCRPAIDFQVGLPGNYDDMFKGFSTVSARLSHQVYSC